MKNHSKIHHSAMKNRPKIHHSAIIDSLLTYLYGYVMSASESDRIRTRRPIDINRELTANHLFTQ